MSARLATLLLLAALAFAGLAPLAAETAPAEVLVASPEDLPAPVEPPRLIDPVRDVRQAAANSILTSLVVAVITYSLALAHAFGVLYFGDWTRRILQFTLGTLLCVSPMVLLLVIYAAKNDIGLFIVLFLAIAVYPLTARLLLNRIHDAAPDFHFLQAKILGHGPLGVFFSYAWPRFLPLTLPFFFLGFIYSLLMESMFSSLGLVTFPHGETWGSLIHRGLDELLDHPGAVFAPGIAIMGTALAAYACIPVFDKLLAVPTELN
jgi:peptide/nickel transport system permease protein